MFFFDFIGIKLRSVEIYFSWRDNTFNPKSRNICITTKFIPWVKHEHLSIE